MNEKMKELQAAIRKEAEKQGLGNVLFKEVVKDNDIRMTGMAIGVTDIRPMMYLDPILEQIDAGLSVESAAEQVVAAYQRIQVPKFPDVGELFKDPADRLFLQAANSTANSERLDGAITETVEGITLAVRLKVGEEGSILIKKEALPMLGMTASEVLEHAVRNTEKQTVIRSMFEALAGAGGIVPEDSAMLVVSNKEGYYGAAGAFVSRAVREEIRSKLNGDFILLPSSVHELIAIPAKAETDELREMVRSINETSVSPDERLSYDVFLVDGSLKIRRLGESEGCNVSDNQAEKAERKQSAGAHL